MQHLSKERLIRDARASYEGLQRGIPTREMVGVYVNDVYCSIRKAEVDFRVLDPTGNTSAGDMKTEFKKVVQTAFITHARALFKELSTLNGKRIGICMERIEEDLNLAKVGIEVLATEGTKSAEAVSKELTEARERSKLARAHPEP